MGSKRKRGKDTWLITISLGKDPKTGKYEKYYETVKGKAEDADERINEIELQVKRGAFIRPSNMTLEEYLKKWLSTYSSSWTYKTHRWYDTNVNYHIIPELGKCYLKDLTKFEILEFYNRKLKTCSRYVVRGIHATLRAALEQAVGVYIHSNPANNIAPPKPSRREEKQKRIVWTPKQAISFLEASRSDRRYALYIAALTTAMRQAELLGLQWPYVDFETRIIHVCQALETDKSGRPLGFKDTKTENGERYIYMTDLLLEALKELKKKQAEEKMKNRQIWDDSWNLVFCQEDGRPYNPLSLTRYNFKNLINKAKVPKIRFHDLRHTSLSLLKALGVDTRIIQEIAGHSSPAFTDKQYIHVAVDIQKEALAKLNAALSK